MGGSFGERSATCWAYGPHRPEDHGSLRRSTHARGRDRRRRPHPDRPRREGVAQGRPRRRPRRGPAARPRRAQPRGRPRADRRHDHGLRLRPRRAGLQRRPQRGAAGGHRPPRARHDGQPLLRLLAAGDPDGLPRHPRRRGRPRTSPPASRRSRASRAGRRSTRIPRLDGARRRALRRLHRRWGTRPRTSPSAAACRARRRTSGRSSPSSARWRRARAATSTARSCPWRSPTAPRSPATTARGPGRRTEKLAGLKPAFRRGRHRHRRQRVPAQRRRRRGPRHVRRRARALGVLRAPASSPPRSAAMRPEIMGLGPIPAVARSSRRPA